MQRFQIILFFLIFIFILSCEKDKLDPNMDICVEEITYDVHIRAIVNSTCAYSGCHDGANAPGDYTSYSKMEPVLDGPVFRSRVLEIRDMPPSYANGATILTESQLVLMRCWIQGGFKDK